MNCGGDASTGLRAPHAARNPYLSHDDREKSELTATGIETTRIYNASTHSCRQSNAKDLDSELLNLN
jgi:hypothetical protein